MEFVNCSFEKKKQKRKRTHTEKCGMSLNDSAKWQYFSTYVCTYFFVYKAVRGQNMRSSMPRGLSHSLTFNPRCTFHDSRTVQLKIPICRPSSTLLTYSRASLHHYGMYWNFKDLSVLTYAYIYVYSVTQ